MNEKMSKYALREIGGDEDLELICRWRMDPKITRYMNTDPKLTLEGQRKWAAKIASDPDVWYRMVLVDGAPAGVINLTHLTDPEGRIGWAYYIGEDRLRSMELAISLEAGMYDHVFGTLGKKAVVSDVFSKNKGVITLHKLLGCKITAVVPDAVTKNGESFEVTYMEMTAERWAEQRKSLKVQGIPFS
ncbi:MAG: GNAT family N-acetyltransferase [Lachnospiraceae bacterium]|nr:GNAT family N-acetyltransferase [Lachnospiraceae bacterium]